MPLALSLFPDLDGVDDLIAESLPWLQAWAVLLGLILIAVVVQGLIEYRARRASPLARLLHRRFG